MSELSYCLMESYINVGNLFACSATGADMADAEVMILSSTLDESVGCRSTLIDDRYTEIRYLASAKTYRLRAGVT